MLDEHVGHVLFADFEVEGEGAVVVAGKSFMQAASTGAMTSLAWPVAIFQRVAGAGLLNFGVWREVFEGEDVVGGETQDGFGREDSG